MSFSIRPYCPAAMTLQKRRCSVLSWMVLLACLALTAPAAVNGNSSGTVAGTAVESLAGNVRQKAMAAYEEEAYEEALPHLKEAYNLNPLDAEVAGRLGYAAKETGAYELALDVLGSAVELRPDDYYYWWWLSDTQRLLGSYADSLKSMERARDVAPADVQEELQGYVAYTAILLDDSPSWDNFDQHMHFAERHRTLRRVRRQIAEYMNALAVAPEVEPHNIEDMGRLGWLHQELGIQYIYIEEPGPAIDHLRQAIRFAHEAGVSREVMRQEQFIAIAYRLKAEREPYEEHRYYENAVLHWQRARDLTLETEDVEYQRYVQGRLLDALSQFRALDDPLLAELRELNLKEVPWEGPINEYSTAEAVFGEAKCRLLEGDYAGARVLFEMAEPYFSDSNFLSDYQRAAELYLYLARTYFQQDHYGESLNLVEKASEKLTDARAFIDADAFNRSAGERMLRHVAAARARANIALDRVDHAFTSVESYQAQRLVNLLGAKIVDDAVRTDAESEQSIVRRRIPLLEALLDEAREAGDDAEAARLTQRLEEDTARLNWLERGDVFPSPQALGFKPLPVTRVQELQESLDADTVFLAYLFDNWGGVVLRIGSDSAQGVLLEADEKTVWNAGTAMRAAAVSREAMDAIAAPLYEQLVAPLLPLPGTSTLVIMPDENLWGASFELLDGEAGPLGRDVAIAYADTASRLKAHLDSDVAAPNRVRFAPGRPAAELPSSVAELGAYETVRVLEGAEIAVSTIVSDVQPGEMLHLAGTLEQTLPDPLLAELVFAPNNDDNVLPAARLLGMNLPAALVVLDWTAPEGARPLRSDVATAFLGMFQHARAGAVLIVAPWVEEEARTLFFTHFYEAAPDLGSGGAYQAARRVLRDAFPGAAYEAGFAFFGDYR